MPDSSGVNPYESPKVSESTTQFPGELRRVASGRFRWRVVPTVLSYAFATCGLSAGTMVCGMAVWWLVKETAPSLDAKLLAACMLAWGTLGGATGAVYLVAARAWWKARWRRAVVATVLGVILHLVFVETQSLLAL